MKKIEIKKDELYDYYISNNHSIDETAKYFNVSRDVILRHNKEYNIKKNKDDIRQKIETTCLEKYGTKTNLQCEETKNKIKQTCLEKYGVEYSHQAVSVIEKTKATNLNKYGNTSFVQTEYVKNKVKKTNLEKYGVENPFYSNDVQHNIQIKNKKRYEILFHEKINQHIDKKEYLKSLIADGNNTISNLSKVSIFSQSYIDVLLKKYNLDDLINFKPRISSYENEICDILKKNGITNIERNSRKYLNKQEIDIYLPDYKIGIEFNGNYWHNETQKNKYYHQQKSLLAASKDIFIFHIFEYEWIKNKYQILNQLFNLLHINITKIYARKCEIREIQSKQKNIFLSNNHRQGSDHSQINLGLFFNNELVGVMTFCKARYSKKYNYELSRFCTRSNLNIIGGASKLFKYFVENYLNNNETIVSYSDNAKTTGKLYEILGFSLDHISAPNYIWWRKGNDIKTRYQSQIKNEVAVMTAKGYRRIYDCGNKVWVFIKKAEE